WAGEYRAFGEVTETQQAWANPLRFPGQYYDAETGTYYNYFRDYDPTIGRYVQGDPIGLRGDLNTYSYVGMNSMIRFDPYGLCDITGEYMDAFITSVTINSVEQVANLRYENDKPYLADIYINGSVDGDVTLKCKNKCECGKTTTRYITEQFSTPNITLKIPIEDSPFSGLTGPGSLGSILSAFSLADKAMSAASLINKYHEIVNHKYTKAVATAICKLFPNRNDGLPYTIDTSP
ncbi:RHS repeat-associated core domain-containing protein, partial [Sedimenticola sp.]|uniref:RHS repeat-associated core domain-containing protein n=1 Tax=Sedimenticola sp. TaxID=1940285 RepID=UPI003D117550